MREKRREKREESLLLRRAVAVNQLVLIRVVVLSCNEVRSWWLEAGETGEVEVGGWAA